MRYVLEETYDDTHQECTRCTWRGGPHDEAFRTCPLCCGGLRKAGTATVIGIWRNAGTDIVALAFEGTAYRWEAAPGIYAVGQEVSVTLPVHSAANITPASPQPAVP